MENPDIKKAPCLYDCSCHEKGFQSLPMMHIVQNGVGKASENMIQMVMISTI